MPLDLPETTANVSLFLLPRVGDRVAVPWLLVAIVLAGGATGLLASSWLWGLITGCLVVAGRAAVRVARRQT